MMSKLLHQNLEQAAAVDPRKDAFRCGEQSVSFGDLDDLTARLAMLLRDQGVQTGDRVAIRLPPCVESAVAVYGVLKSGAAFVPIDPLTPDQRLCELLETGKIRHLITMRLQAKTKDRLEADAKSLQSIIGVQHLGESRFRTMDWKTIGDFEPTPSVPQKRESPAYVIFTSGSTGSPKGIVHTHFSGQSYAELSVKTYHVRPDDRIANLSPLHFDMSTFGFLSAVLAGATTVLVPPAYAKLPASLSQLLQQERITIWYSVPFALIQLLERGVLEQRDLSTLRWVLFGGEPFSPKHVNRLRKLWPAAQFSNVYGPAEVNQCTYFHIPKANDSPDWLPEDRPVPIGRIWDETRALVVDENDRSVSLGASGELLVNSTTMMKRYWHGTENDPKSFFVPEASTDRYYRTGDIVQETTDGVLLFLGRRDRQVKVRGYRIELDEIEHALVRHNEVEEGAVIAIDSGGGLLVAASAVIARQSNLTAERLREFLASNLPAYAVPSKIVIRDDFPRTTSGKVDRRSLALELQAEQDDIPV